MHRVKNTNKHHFLVSIAYALFVLSILGNCTPISDDVCVGCVSSEINENEDKWDEDPTLLTVPEIYGESRIFGDILNSTANNSVLTVAGFVIVGIILFGEVIKFLFL